MAVTDLGELLSLSVDAATQVGARWLSPAGARACYVMAHGAGAGMEHPFLRSVAADLAAAGIATLRYQFPYMERGARRPDPPPRCHATVRAALALARARAPQLPLFCGGRSFGGRMSSQALAAVPDATVRGLAFLGFPLHPAGRPGIERAAHLRELAQPLLFIQGTRDELAERALLEPLIAALGARASVAWVEDADHAFHVPARSGRRDADVRRSLADTLATWLTRPA